MPSFFSWVADAEFGPKVETHAFADQRERTTDQRLACDNRSGCRNDNARYQKPGWHDTVENTAFAGIKNFPMIVGKKPCALPQII